MSHFPLSPNEAEQFVADATDTEREAVQVYMQSLHFDDDDRSHEDLADELEYLPWIHRAVFIGGEIRLLFDEDNDPMAAPSVDAVLAARMIKALKHFSEIDFDRYLYHSANRPVWIGAVSSIADEEGIDREKLTLVGSSETSFTVETPHELDDSTIQSFELKRVHEVPEDDVQMHT